MFGGIYMKNKKMILAIVALAAVIALMAGLFLANKPQAVEGSKQVTITIIHKDGTEKNLEYATDLEFLSELLLEKELVTGYESEEFGFTIEGEAYATTSAAGIVLTDGGVYQLIYESF